MKLACAQLFFGLVSIVVLSGLCAAMLPPFLEPQSVGYTDTPFLPDSEWRVHDGRRPQPTVITAAGASTQERAGQPPSDAVVLFDGSSLEAWQKSGGGEPGWKLENGYVEVTRSGSIETKQSFGDLQLHLEFCSPVVVSGDSQGGNSGVFLHGRYEIQILDSHQNATYPDGQAAAMYGQYPPLVNSSRGPGQWQTYDILFTAPRFEGEKLISSAYVTMLHNGVVVHNHRAYLGATTHRRVPSYKSHPDKGRIQLQDHANPVRFRNIWVRPLN
jgi:hypothetical protein